MLVFGKIAELAKLIFRIESGGKTITVDPAAVTQTALDSTVHFPDLKTSGTKAFIIKDLEQITNGDISPSAAIMDTKLATITSAGKVANSATTATDQILPSTIVLRDTLGDTSIRRVIAPGGAPTFLGFVGNLTGTADNVRGVVAIANGGTGANTTTGALDNISPINAAGDIIIGSSTGSNIKLPRGADGKVLLVDDLEPDKLRWSYPSGFYTTPNPPGPMYTDGNNAKSLPFAANQGKVFGVNTAGTGPDLKTLSLGSAGTQPNWDASVNGTLKLNLPYASAVASGIVSTVAQYLKGNKVFIDTPFIQDPLTGFVLGSQDKVVLWSNATGNVAAGLISDAFVAPGANIAGSKMQAAAYGNAGVVTVGAQTFGGDKTIKGLAGGNPGVISVSSSDDWWAKLSAPAGGGTVELTTLSHFRIRTGGNSPGGVIAMSISSANQQASFTRVTRNLQGLVSGGGGGAINSYGASSSAGAVVGPMVYLGTWLLYWNNPNAIGFASNPTTYPAGIRNSFRDYIWNHQFNRNVFCVAHNSSFATNTTLDVQATQQIDLNNTLIRSATNNSGSDQQMLISVYGFDV